MKIAILGRTQILYETMLRLVEMGHEIGCIITAPASPEYTRKEDDFQIFAEKFQIPFLLTNSLKHPDVEKYCVGLDLAVSMNWVSVIQVEHIQMFKLGILNSHMGDLPQYRGNACPNWAILKNESQITNSIHWMEGGKLDCGKIIHQESFQLEENSSISDIYQWAEAFIPGMFIQALEKINQNNAYYLKYADESSIDAFRCFPRLPEDNFIDWNLPISDIHNLIRAVSYPFSGAYTYQFYQGKLKKLLVFKSRIITHETNDLAVPGHVLANNKETGESFVRCGQGVLSLLECKYDDEAEVFSPGSRWKSIRMRLGVRSEDLIWYFLSKKTE